MYEQDYILRLARQLAVVLARVLGMRKRGQDEQVIAAVDSAAGDLLGLPAGAFDRLDGATLARLLKEPSLCGHVADLLDEEAASHEALGHADVAARRRRLAAELRLSGR